MSTTMELQTLLRFLSRDAKIPLPVAMSKMKDLQKASLTSPDLFAKADLQAVKAIFVEDKHAKQIINAAKRVTKKRSMSDADSTSPVKHKKPTLTNSHDNPAAVEESLALPYAEPTITEAELGTIIIYTNRAPLVLAFAIMLLNYTMPEQPISSRLSLAQAVVSANSKTKAISLGIDQGKSAEDEGWGQGQPQVRILGRSIRVMKRWGYEYEETLGTDSAEALKDEISAIQKIESATVIKTEEPQEQTIDPNPIPRSDKEPALWGLDLEALRSSKHPTPQNSTLPIHQPKSARDYLLRSFASPTPPTPSSSPTKKRSSKQLEAERSRNLALLLHTLDLLYTSWAHVLRREELDRRAWSWYVAVRPEVANGVAGWGGKGKVKLSQILELRRKG